MNVFNQLLTLTILAAAASLAMADEPAAPLPPPASADDFEDAALPLAPAHPRSSQEQTRLQARALFAAARTHEQKEEYAAALKLYERALRLDPNSLAILRQVVLVGILHYDRVSEVLPYALRLVERDPSFAPQLRQMSQSLVERGDLAGALRLLQKSLDADPIDNRTARYILLRNEIGRLMFLTEDFTGAAVAFAEVVEALDKPEEFQLGRDVVKAILDPPGKTWSLFGEAFLRADRPEKAVETFRKAFHDDKQKPLLGYHLARAYLAAGDAERALTELRTFLDSAETSEGAAPYKLLGDILSKLDRAAEYLPQLEELHQKKPDHAELGLHLAEQYRAAGKADQAIALYEQVLEKAPQAQGFAGLAALYRAAGEDEKLLRILGRYVAQNGDLASLGDEAEALRKDSDELARLLAKCRKLRQDQPDSFDYGMRFLTALLAIAAEDYETAGEFYRLAIEAKPESAAELYMGWGASLLIADKSAEAADVFQQAIARKVLPDDNPVFHYYLSGALEMTGQTAAALAAIDHAVKTAPDSPRLYSRVAWIYYHARQYSEAARAYEDLIDKFAEAGSASTEVRRLVREARLALSNICVQQKNMPAAEEWLEQILDESPDDAGALNDLAYIWADQGKHLERALKMAEQAVAAEPDNAAYQDTLGWAFYRLGRFEEALPPLLKACSGEKVDGVVLDHLADTHWALKQTDAAKAAWQKALEEFDEKEDAERIEATKEKLKRADTP